MTTDERDRPRDPGTPESPVEPAALVDPASSTAPRSDAEIAEFGPTLPVEPTAPLDGPLPTDEDDFLLNLRRAKTKRLQGLYLKRGNFGKNLPIEDVVEIAELEQELGLTNLAINAPITTKFADELGSSGQFQITTQMIGSTKESFKEGIDSLKELFRESMANINERLAMVDASGRERVAQLAERLEVGEEIQREYRQTDHKNRLHSQTTLRLLLVFIIVVLAVVVGANIWMGYTIESLKQIVERLTHG